MIVAVAVAFYLASRPNGVRPLASLLILLAGLSAFAVIDALSHSDEAWGVVGTRRAAWLLVIVSLPAIGPALYFFNVRSRIEREFA